MALSRIYATESGPVGDSTRTDGSGCVRRRFENVCGSCAYRAIMVDRCVASLGPLANWRLATLAHGATKQILKAWSQGGLGAADRLLPDIGAGLAVSAYFERSIPNAVDAIRRGAPRPAVVFEGR